MAIHRTCDWFEAWVVQKSQWPVWEGIRLVILGPEFKSLPKFCLVFNILTNSTHLTNLLSRN